MIDLKYGKNCLSVMFVTFCFRDPALSVSGVTSGAFRPPSKMSKGGVAAAAGHSGSTQICSARVSATAKTFISPASTHTPSSFSSSASLPQQLHESMSDKKTSVFAYRKLEYTKSLVNVR